MTLIAEFTVVGKQATQGSKRHVGRGILVDSCKELRPWRAAVAAACAEVYRGPVLRDCAFVLRVRFTRPRPQAHFGSGKNAAKLKPSAPWYWTTKQDLTKLVRPIEDALTGVVWFDDAQIVEHQTSKVWGPRYETHVAIERLENTR